jgi:hypothetical protein
MSDKPYPGLYLIVRNFKILKIAAMNYIFKGYHIFNWKIIESLINKQNLPVESRKGYLKDCCEV